MTDALEILQKYYGYSAFRSGQEQVVRAIMDGEDAVGIMPTGAGKSLCYQVPALLLPGVTLVVSPLISLMKDQVNALTQAGVPAAFINSSLSAAQVNKVLEQAQNGHYRILYVAPERLFAPRFVEYAARADIPFVSVDEAHCVSQWGQDFRPSYLKIREFIDILPRRPVIGAFTATATGEVRRDIVDMLGLRDPQVVATGYDRPNLFYQVCHPQNKFAQLLSFMRRHEEDSGIVYCLTRKTVEEVCERLRGQGFSASRYHAGLSPEERRRNQEKFQSDDVRVMVATNAFGMGIDKSNVSFVVHYNMPKNLESYYQEAGRAGRDGAPAECVLLYGGRDVATNRFFIDNAEENGGMDPEIREQFRERELERLKQMTFYCHTRECLREYILRYFGERPTGFCGNCYNCQNFFERADITVPSQKILSCIKRMGERYGTKLLVDTLRGSDNERVRRLGFARLPTFGIMADTGERQLRDMINHLISKGYIRQTDDEYPVLQLGEGARDVLFRGAQVWMNMVQQQAPAKAARSRRSTGSNPRLFSKLQALRGQLAKAQSVPAYVIFPDATLLEMCERKPQTEHQLLQISGVGQVKLKRYGNAFLELLKETEGPEGEH